MIPTMILFGLLFGRWWRVALVVAAVGWPVLLLGTADLSGPQLLGSAVLAVLNAGLGVLGHQAILGLVRIARAGSAPRRADGNDAARSRYGAG